MSLDRKKAREFWVEEGLLDSCDIPIDDVDILHIIEYSAYRIVEKKLAIAVETLEQARKSKVGMADVIHEALNKIKGEMK